MKMNRYKIVWSILVCTSLIFGQKQSKNIKEKFNVNNDVLVEINTDNTDVIIEVWNKNTVSIEGVMVVDGMTEKEAAKYFENWKFEALGNKSKVVIRSGIGEDPYMVHEIFEGIDFDFDFDSISYIGEIFNGNFYSDLPSIPPLPQLPDMVIENLSEMEFNFEAFQNNKEEYLEKFAKDSEKWQKEFEEKVKPQMEEYEEKMKEWEKMMEPRMEKFEKMMDEWGKDFEKTIEPQMKDFEIKMEKMEKELGEKYAIKMKEKGIFISSNENSDRSLLIKIPKGALVKLDVNHGKIQMPKDIKIVD